VPPIDFFSFCTSLQLLELKALGELSKVKQFEEDDCVYSPGEEGDELFIINRGLVELRPANALPGTMPMVVTRGDMFGEVGAFMQLPRNETARARAAVSVQCFRSQDFPELQRRTPAFFSFLCKKLAHHLFQAREMNRSQNSVSELAGSLANFDMVTIYQTIIRSDQSGLLTIVDEHGETVCQFYFESGLPRWCRFRHLTGEEAFCELFIQSRRAWSFSFSQKAPGQLECGNENALNRNPEAMLLRAVQMRDEFEELRKRMADDSASIKRKQLNFAWPNANDDGLREVGEEIWQIAYSQPLSLLELSQRSSACVLKVYRAVDEMVRGGLYDLQNGAGASAALANGKS
jgi:CRP-like cAMP-binding protein